MQIIYKRIKINDSLLKITPNEAENLKIEDYKNGTITDTLPTGKVKGVYFIPYINNSTSHIMERGFGGNMYSNSLNLIDITIKDVQGIQITENVCIADYAHKLGGYEQGFKKLNFESKNEKITIEWNTIGNNTTADTNILCGEFIFMIEKENCNC